MSGISREDRYEPLRDQAMASDGAYNPNWENADKTAPPKPVITKTYMFYVACVVLFDLGLISMFCFVLSLGQSWDKMPTGNKIWLIMAPVYTLVTIFVVGIFISAWLSIHRLNRA